MYLVNLNNLDKIYFHYNPYIYNSPIHNFLKNGAMVMLIKPHKLVNIGKYNY